MIADLLGRGRLGRARGRDRRHLSARARRRRPTRHMQERRTTGKLLLDPSPNERELRRRTATTSFAGARPVRGAAADAGRARLRRADADPGAGDPRAARRPRRDRPGADRQRQDRRLRPADARVHRPGERGDAGDRPHPDARALHPGDPGAARLRRAPRGRRTSWRSSAARRSASSSRGCATAPRSSSPRSAG